MKGSIPVHREGVFLYRAYDKRGRLLYVGISRDLLSRGHKRDLLADCWYHLAHRIAWELLPITWAEALVIEQRVIRAERPKHNIAGILPPEPLPENLVWLCPPVVLPSHEELAIAEARSLNLGDL